MATEALEMLRAEALDSFYVFARGVLGFRALYEPVHGRLAEFLERSARRKRVTLPRGFFKTTMCSVAYPLWRAGRNPDIRILIAMKTLPNAMRTIDQIRDIVEKNELFRALFPEVVPLSTRDTTWSSQAACLRRPGVFREATFEAAGIGTTVISRHYDLIIEDDLVAPAKDDMTGLEAMPTREEIEHAIGWHKLADSLFADPGGGELINVGTRWSKFDLIQYLIDNEPGMESFELAAVDENGQPTFPTRFPLEVLREIEERQGTYLYSAQYLNRPYDEARMVFREEWLRHWWDGEPPQGIVKALIVDPAISRKSEADFSVAVVVGAYDRKLYVMDYRRGHFDPSTLIEHMLDLATTWNVLDVFVEAVAWQEALAHFYDVRARELGRFFNVVPIRPGRDEPKDLRIRGLQPLAQRGALLLRPWMRELLMELRDFPFSKTLDVADAVAYGPRVLAHALTIPARPESVRPQVETVGDVVEKLRRRGSTMWGFWVRSNVERAVGW